MNVLVNLLKRRRFRLYGDAEEAVPKAKAHGFKTAIVTTIAHFKFEEAIKPIRECFDFVMTGYEAGCDKSNPKMYRRLLEILRIRPYEVVMIGDDLQLDVELPRRLGMKAILLDRNRRETGQSVDASVYDLNEAMEIVINKLWRK